jgi:hypothetical protein
MEVWAALQELRSPMRGVVAHPRSGESGAFDGC